MPMHQCLSCRYWEHQIKDYVVRFECTPHGPYEHDYTCTCKGFKFNRKCKHIEEAKSHHCGWHEQFEGGDLVDGKCPKCGGEVEVVMCGV